MKEKYAYNKGMGSRDSLLPLQGQRQSPQAGNTLIMVMVSLAMISAIVLVMAQMSSEQSKSLKHFQQKTDALELENFMSLQLGRQGVCAWQFQAKGAALNTTLSPAQLKNTKFDFDALYAGGDNTSPKLAEVNITSLNGMKVKNIRVTDFVNLNDPNGGRYEANFVIEFDQLTAARPTAPILLKKIITIDTVGGTPSARKITGCATLGGAVPTVKSFDCGIWDGASTKANLFGGTFVGPNGNTLEYWSGRVLSGDPHWCFALFDQTTNDWDCHLYCKYDDLHECQGSPGALSRCSEGIRYWPYRKPF